MMIELFDELKKLVDDEKKVTKISIIGYSLGGLVSRYIIGELEKMDFFDTVEPVYLASFASPHLGVWFFKKHQPLLNILGYNVLGLAGSQLFIKDEEKILLKLTEGDYIIGLRKFKKRFCFANVRHDRTVSFYTAFMTNKNPFDENWEELSLSFKFEEDIIPTYNIKGKNIRPHIVNFKTSKFKTQKEEEQFQIVKKLKYTGIILLFSLILPIWIPVVFTVTSIGSIFSYIIVKNHRKPDLHGLLLKSQTKTFGSIDNSELESTSLLETQMVNIRDRIDEVTGDTLEQVINIPDYERSELDKEEQETKDELKQTLENLHLKCDEIFKNPKVEETKLFENSTEIPLDEDRKKIHDRLNELDWYKFAVFVNVLNAHDGIVARKGLKKSTIKGIAVITFFADLINEDMKT